ncbi:hypothetical protein N7320_02150 [Stutzerimonas stutzeri]|uniref:hypothetical protein n=1 Tax=Stutzerimonas stutzeri TaxID=316 RepID=UPI00244B7D64|nr:hypothetical protein [Stutzerimonas stutzeri]MDH0100116.1 hypothetical protein [Stutzerimonas stutzeri]
MRLNGSTLNGRALNGRARLPVRGAGQAASDLGVALAATRTVHGNTVLVSALSAEFMASATRHAQGSWSIRVSPALAQTVARGATGEAVLGLNASLFYTREVQGFGSAQFNLEMQGHVGVVFIEGVAELLPMQVDLAGAKKVLGAGQGVFGLYGDGAPSAVRRFRSVAVPLTLTGEAEASHIDANGTRYVGFAGDGTVGLQVEDAGMLRQSFIGSLDFGFVGTGDGSLQKPTLAGEAVTTLSLAGDFRAVRRAESAAVLSMRAAADGEILVRGEGSALLGFRAELTGYRTTHPLLTAAPVALEIIANGTRVPIGRGAVSIGIELSPTGARRRVGIGDAVFEVLGESEAYVNPFSEDVDEQTFRRPSSLRTYPRPAMPREWRR